MSGCEAVFNLWDRLHRNNVAKTASANKVASTSSSSAFDNKAADKAVKEGSPNCLRMSELVDATEFYKKVVALYQEHAKDRRSTLVFCSRIKMVAGMLKGFIDGGVKAQSISASTRPVDREALIASFARAEYPVLINCQVLTQGFDMPAVSHSAELFWSHILILDRLHHHGKTD